MVDRTRTPNPIGQYFLRIAQRMRETVARKRVAVTVCCGVLSGALLSVSGDVLGGTLAATGMAVAAVPDRRSKRERIADLRVEQEKARQAVEDAIRTHGSGSPETAEAKLVVNRIGKRIVKAQEEGALKDERLQPCHRHCDRSELQEELRALPGYIEDLERAKEAVEDARRRVVEGTVTRQFLENAKDVQSKLFARVSSLTQAAEKVLLDSCTSSSELKAYAACERVRHQLGVLRGHRAQEVKVLKALAAQRKHPEPKQIAGLLSTATSDLKWIDEAIVKADAALEDARQACVFA